MSKLMIEIPAELKEVLDRYPEVHWEQVAETALWQFAGKVRLADKLAARSKLTATGADAIGRALEASLRRRYATAAR